MIFHSSATGRRLATLGTCNHSIFLSLIRRCFQEEFVASTGAYFRKTGAQSALSDESYFREVMKLSQPKIRAVDEVPAYTSYFWSDEFPVDAKAKEKVMAKGEPK